MSADTVGELLCVGKLVLQRCLPRLMARSVVDVVMGGDLADARLWARELDAVVSALAYMWGLIAPLQRKNGWTVAEEAGHDGLDRIQRMLNRIEWGTPVS